MPLNNTFNIPLMQQMLLMTTCYHGKRDLYIFYKKTIAINNNITQYIYIKPLW